MQIFYPVLLALLPSNVVVALSVPTPTVQTCKDLTGVITEAGHVTALGCKAVALNSATVDGCECSLRGNSCPFDCSGEGEVGCLKAPGRFGGLSSVTAGVPFSAAEIGGSIIACMYWGPHAPTAPVSAKATKKAVKKSVERVEGLIRSANDAATANAANAVKGFWDSTPPPVLPPFPYTHNATAPAASLLAEVAHGNLPPEDIFRTRCLTFSHGVVLQSGGKRDAARTLLQDHCQERKSGLEVSKLSSKQEARCQHYAGLWLDVDGDWTTIEARTAWCHELYRSTTPAFVATPALLSRRVFFRKIYFGAPHGTAALEAFLRCAPNVESTEAGTFHGLDAVEVVYTDPPGLNRASELVAAYHAHEAAGSGFGCVKPECRSAVICTTAEQMAQIPSCECVSIISSNGAFQGLPPSEQGLTAPTCSSPAPNDRLHGSDAADIVLPGSC